ncbi:hypothetical protein L2E82_11203 [Cichorium intybus]|uniref:Uncharacterized protein n=1 Tax=Cichorium intybus TaxID=13427 RepID=A0ACB9GDW2_CICIN|nr:hypothetical protein L2E82_11203 [Cichorium intybus]
MKSLSFAVRSLLEKTVSELGSAAVSGFAEWAGSGLFWSCSGAVSGLFLGCSRLFSWTVPELVLIGPEPASIEPFHKLASEYGDYTTNDGNCHGLVTTVKGSRIPFDEMNRNEFNREGAGGGNWGTPADDITWETKEVVVKGEKNLGFDKPLTEDERTNEKKENTVNEPEEKELEDKEMTLEEYQKVLKEKGKLLRHLK